MMPSQNAGADWPISANTMAAPSMKLLRRTAEITPSGIATTSEMIKAATASSAVAGNRSSTSGRAGS